MDETGKKMYNDLVIALESQGMIEHVSAEHTKIEIDEEAEEAEEKEYIDRVVVTYGRPFKSTGVIRENNE